MMPTNFSTDTWKITIELHIYSPKLSLHRAWLHERFQELYLSPSTQWNNIFCILECKCSSFFCFFKLIIYLHKTPSTKCKQFIEEFWCKESTMYKMRAYELKSSWKWICWFNYYERMHQDTGYGVLTPLLRLQLCAECLIHWNIMTK